MTAAKFVEKYDLYRPEDHRAAEHAIDTINREGIEVVRVVWPDQHGLLRGKALTVPAFLAAMKAGNEITMAPLLLRHRQRHRVQPVQPPTADSTSTASAAAPTSRWCPIPGPSPCCRGRRRPPGLLRSLHVRRQAVPARPAHHPQEHTGRDGVERLQDGRRHRDGVVPHQGRGQRARHLLSRCTRFAGRPADGRPPGRPRLQLPARRSPRRGRRHPASDPERSVGHGVADPFVRRRVGSQPDGDHVRHP